MKRTYHRYTGKIFYTGIKSTLIALIFTFLGSAVYASPTSKSSEDYFKEKTTLKTITGKVTDESGSPLPGVNVIIEGTNRGTQTDFDGNYSLEAEPGEKIQFSFLGFATKTVEIGNDSVINVRLAEEASTLNEIVVVGYGTQRKSDVTGAVSQVKTDDFEEQPINRVEEILQGRASGISVARANGTPGSNVKIRVRGVNSITGNNDPLVVVDGIFGGDLRTINPNDIASIEVLKDASALAIYGSRGSNGVILVTTKKGRGKTKINFEQFTSITSLREKIDGILSSSEFATIKNEQAAEAGNALPFTNERIEELRRNPIDYQDIFFRSALSQNYQLSASGGSDNMSYFISGNYTDQEGIMVTNKYDRYSIRANVNSNVGEKLKVGINAYGSRERELNNPNAFNRFKGGPVLQTITWDPTSPVRDADGNYIFKGQFANNNPTNYIADLERSKIERIADRTNLNFNLDYQIFEPLSYKILVGANILNQVSNDFRIEDNETREFDTNRRATNNNIKDTFYQISNILNFKKDFGKHNLDVTGVYEYQITRRTENRTGIFNVVQGVDNFFRADDNTRKEDLSITHLSNKSALQSLLGRVNYSFDNSLLVTASIRRDASSSFLEDERVGYFPSAAIAYSFNNLSFIENSNTFNALKLRLGWGQVGNENVPGSPFNDRFNTSRSFSPTDGINESVLITDLTGNPNLTWETTTQTNIGLDVGLLNNRINMSLDFYKKNTEDLILRRLFLITFPENFFFENVGEVENTGVDFSINADIIRNDNFTWNSALNLSFLKNEVTELYGDVERIPGTVPSLSTQGQVLNIIEEGEPLGQFNGLTYLGVWEEGDDLPATAQVGDARYLTNENGEEVVGSIGNGIPTYNWGFNNTLNYKNWDFNLFITGAGGFDVYNQVTASLEGDGSDFRDNLFTGTLIPNNRKFSSKYVEKGDFIRLSNLSLGYTIKEPFKGMEFAKIYMSGQNLFLITDYSAYDPEVSSIQPNAGQNNPDVGTSIDLGDIPNPKVFTLGVKLGF